MKGNVIVLNAEIEADVEIVVPAKPEKAPRFHGGNLYAAALRYGLEEKKIVDFSSSVNPLGPSSSVKRAVKKSLSVLDRYPDPETSELRKSIARYFGIKPDQILCGGGASSLMHLVPRVFRPKRVLIPVPSYSEYAAAAVNSGGVVIPLSLKPQDGFRIDPVELAFAIKTADMAILCNPNNPTGLVIPKSEMLEIASYARENGVTLVVDESFMDYQESDSIAKEATQSPNIICIRSFTRFFGMPGLRIGYVISSESNIAALREGSEPWTVSAPAERAACAALNDWGHIKKTRKLIEKEREWLLSTLRLLPGVEPFQPAANFIFLKCASIDSSSLADQLGYRGMLVRDCSSFFGPGSSYIRISVRTRCENRRLVRALRRILIT